MLRLAHLICAAAFLWLHVVITQRGSFMSMPEHRAAATFTKEVLSSQPGLAMTLALPLIVFAGLYLLFFWLVAVLATPRKPSPVAAHLGIVGATWTASIWLLLLANQSWFPRSAWTWWTEPIFAPVAAHAVSGLSAAWISCRIFITARHYGLLGIRHCGTAEPRFRNAVVASALLIPLSVWGIQNSIATSAGSTVTAGPNLVIIGLDSLRRDVALGERAADIPNITAFREGAFTEANIVSPIARTFPAWATILTGKDPLVSGARDNLIAQAPLPRDQSFAWKLKALGYRTIYATDETRFSNIGPEFGFDEIVGPQQGATDFLISQFADQPLINIILQVPFAERLLPSLVGNRALAHAYHPQRFLERLSDSIGSADSRPTALAVHLCLAHWPYYSAGTAPGEKGDGFGLYLRAVQELDVQFGQLLNELQRLGYVNQRTLVVVLADHGEALTQHESRPTSLISHAPELPVPAAGVGHGSSLLNPAQWQVFAMFSGHSSLGPIPRGRSERLGSLADLSPTLIRLLGQPQEPDAYALSVIAALSGEPASADRVRSHIEIETGFTPKGIDLTRPDTGKAMAVAAHSYNVLDNGRVEMKDAVYRHIVDARDFGVTDGRGILALVQTIKEPVLVSVNPDGRWDIYPYIRPADLAETPPLMDLACQSPEARRRLPSWCS